ncbi:MAG: replication-associated recombination protein A [Rhodoluna sp.]|nr:replication-associated recombination protein A [Rhodoluna sp.]
MPLAARMRPRELKEVYGQLEVLGPNTVLGQLLSGDSDTLAQIPSLILYGPPGTGKTTIARLLARQMNRRFIEVSAINSSIADLRAAMQNSMADIRNGKSAAIVFIDEIHRFSRVQQESLLKAVEDGEIVLVGATTENPSFALTSAILSRSSVIDLFPLSSLDLVSILNLALEDERGLGGAISAPEGVLELIANLSSGDARKALTVLETAVMGAQRTKSDKITVEHVESALNKALNRYDSNGDQHYDIISAFIKSVRGSDVDAALHWLARMIVGGEDPRFIARRLVILAAEDIGLADPNALVIANSAMQIVAQIGMPEGRIPLASTTIYLSLAPKSNRAYLAIDNAISEVETGLTPSVPSHLRSAAIGKDPSYVYPHDLDSGISNQSYVPVEAVRTYYKPKEIGFETTLAERLKRVIAILRRKL